MYGVHWVPYNEAWLNMIKVGENDCLFMSGSKMHRGLFYDTNWCFALQWENARWCKQGRRHTKMKSDEEFSLLLPDGVHDLHIRSNPFMHFSSESQVSTRWRHLQNIEDDQCHLQFYDPQVFALKNVYTKHMTLCRRFNHPNVFLKFCVNNCASGMIHKANLHISLCKWPWKYIKLSGWQGIHHLWLTNQ
jgi:hypothetical protein